MTGTMFKSTNTYYNRDNILDVYGVHIENIILGS